MTKVGSKCIELKKLVTSCHTYNTLSKYT